MEKKFSVDWFSGNIVNITGYLSDLKDKENIHILEIGSFEGRSSCFFYEEFIMNSPKSTLTCVDTWEGSMEHSKEIKETIWNTFNHNISEYDTDKLIVKRGYSCDIVRSLAKNYYDFIYVDGSHTSKDVLEDAVLSFYALKSGGIMTFDDYDWFAYQDPLLNPRPGIDSFLLCYHHYINLLERGHQVAVRKK